MPGPSATPAAYTRACEYCCLLASDLCLLTFFPHVSPRSVSDSQLARQHVKGLWVSDYVSARSPACAQIGLKFGALTLCPVLTRLAWLPKKRYAVGQLELMQVVIYLLLGIFLIARQASSEPATLRLGAHVPVYKAAEFDGRVYMLLCGILMSEMLFPVLVTLL